MTVDLDAKVANVLKQTYGQRKQVYNYINKIYSARKCVSKQNDI